MWKRWTAGALACGLLLVAGVAGCSSGGSSESHGASSAGDGVPRAAAPGLNSGAGKAASAPKTQPTLAPADVQRSIIYTGTMTVRVKDVDAAAAAADAIAKSDGGYVGGDDREIDASRSIATVTLRVPADRFDSTVTALGALGQEQSRQISTKDVTDQVVDVQSRLKTQQASVNRIRALIAGTTSISQIVALEDELTQRESDLESMEAQLRSLTDLTTLSTITIVLLGPEARIAVKPSHKTGFVAGLKAGWNGFVKSLSILATVIGAILPFGIVIGALVSVVWFARRRRRPTPPTAPDPD